MQKRPPALALAALLILFTPGLARAACDGKVGETGPVSIDVGSTRRLFIVRVPSSRADGRTPLPVVFAFHPFGMNAQYMESRVSNRFWPETLLVYPEGVRGPAGPSWQTRPGEAGDRDVQFFDAIVSWLQRAHCIDASRVFIMGYSNGAAFANVLACTRAEAIAGVALASGRPVCAPAAPKPAIVTHGTRDTTVPYEQALEAIRVWSRVNGCAAPPPAGQAGCVAAQSCRAAPVALCTYQGGHEYNASFSQAFLEFFREGK